MSTILIPILLVAGIIYRFVIGQAVPQPFVFDQTEYHDFALRILDSGIAAFSARLYGYPIFIAFVYKLFGAGNLNAIYAVQAILDSCTAYIVYKSAFSIFKSRKAAFAAFLIYILNPFTSTFTGVVLSETLAVFLSALSVFFFIESSVKRKIKWFPVLGLILGYLVQVRPAFLFYSILIEFILIARILKDSEYRKKALIIFVSAFLFLLPFFYNVFGNLKHYGQFSPMTVDNLFVREFYISLFVPGRSPFFANSSDVFPTEVQKLYSEYSVKPRNRAERKAVAWEYLNIAVRKVAEDPYLFILSRIGKFLYVWEKHFLYYYQQPKNAVLDYTVYWGNNLLHILALAGIIIWNKAARSKHESLFTFFTLFTIGYISLVFSFSLTEERYSLPAYPLIMMFGGYACIRINKIIFRK